MYMYISFFSFKSFRTKISIFTPSPWQIQYHYYNAMANSNSSCMCLINNQRICSIIKIIPQDIKTHSFRDIDENALVTRK